MSLPVYVAATSDLLDAAPGVTVHVRGPEMRHAVTVRRTGVGERLRLTDGEGLLVTGVVSHVATDELALIVEEVDRIPEPRQRFVLVQALAKNDRDDQAIEAATELGVDGVIPWQAARSIVQWKGERGAKAHAKWDALLLSATKQSRRARRPRLEPLVSSSVLAQRIAAAEAAFVLHEEASQPLAGADLPEDGEVLLIVGPEGGISPDELRDFTDAGAQLVRLGSTVLRSSSAGPAALAVLNAATRWI